MTQCYWVFIKHMVPICSKNCIMSTGTTSLCSCTPSKPGVNERNLDLNINYDRKNYKITNYMIH